MPGFQVVRLGNGVREIGTIHDYKTGKTSLLVSRAHGKNSFSEEYSTSQTNTMIITPASGKKLDIVSVMIDINGNTGTVSLDFATSLKKVMRVYVAKTQHTVSGDLHIDGATNEVLTLNTTTGDVEVFIIVNYREVD